MMPTVQQKRSTVSKSKHKNPPRTFTVMKLITTLLGILYGQLYCLAKCTKRYNIAGKCFEWISSTFHDCEPCSGSANSLLISSSSCPNFCFWKVTDCVTSVSVPRSIFASFSITLKTSAYATN